MRKFCHEHATLPHSKVLQHVLKPNVRIAAFE